MSSRHHFGRLVAALVLAAGACSRVHPSADVTEEAPAAASREWPRVRADAVAAAMTRDPRRVDSVLRAFAARHPGTREAAHSTYLRGLLLLDPATEAKASNESTREARNALAAYVAGGPSQEHYVEALVLQRLTGHLDSLRETAELIGGDIARSAGRAAPQQPGLIAFRDTLRARGAEIDRLTKELDASRAELERIRRRVAPRRP